MREGWNDAVPCWKRSLSDHAQINHHLGVMTLTEEAVGLPGDGRSCALAQPVPISAGGLWEIRGPADYREAIRMNRSCAPRQ
jgi:hypothetical protein